MRRVLIGQEEFLDSVKNIPGTNACGQDLNFIKKKNENTFFTIICMRSAREIRKRFANTHETKKKNTIKEELHAVMAQFQ